MTLLPRKKYSGYILHSNKTYQNGKRFIATNNKSTEIFGEGLYENKIGLNVSHAL